MSRAPLFGNGATPRQLARRSSRSRGVAMVEYAFLLTFVAIPAICGFTAGGIAMYRGYIRVRNHLLLPTP